MSYNKQLLVAVRSGNMELLKDAIDNGADLDAKNNYGRTAAMWAARRGHTKCLALLIQAGADLNAKNENGDTAAMLAAEYEHTESMALLIEAGADLDARDNSGWTAAMRATENGNPKCLALLINAGIDPTKEAIHEKTLLEIAQDKRWENVISAWENQVMLKKVGQRTSREEGDSFGL